MTSQNPIQQSLFPNNRHKIEIQEPIWKDRSIGLNIQDLSIDTIIEVTIAYRNKQGVLVYPETYEISVQEVLKYPVKYVKRGIPLHSIPIKSLKVKP